MNRQDGTIEKMARDIPKKDKLNWFRKMLLIRRFEESLIRTVDSGGHRTGHFHVYIGQETTGVPAISQLSKDDYIFSTHRNHGHLLARGADPGRLLAEILGRETGLNKGKSGTLHAASPELGFLSTSAIVAGNIPVATGVAFAAKQKGTRQVSLCMFGDGSMEEGAFYEAINIASIWSLPVIYLCENNSLAVARKRKGSLQSTGLNLNLSDSNASKKLTDLPSAFQIPTITVDGTDADAVYSAMRTAISRARTRNGGPTFIEARTARWPGSRGVWPELSTGETDLAMAWDKKLVRGRFREWFGEWDGLLKFARELIRANLTDRQQILELDRGVRKEIESAVRYALDSPWPKPEDAMRDVYATV